MEHNLKTFPEWDNTEYKIKAEKWFEGFEKELPEVFKSIFDVWDKLPSEQLKQFVHNRYMEILGET